NLHLIIWRGSRHVQGFAAVPIDNFVGVPPPVVVELPLLVISTAERPLLDLNMVFRPGVDNVEDLPAIDIDDQVVTVVEVDDVPLLRYGAVEMILLNNHTAITAAPRDIQELIARCVLNKPVGSRSGQIAGPEPAQAEDNRSHDSREPHHWKL